MSIALSVPAPAAAARLERGSFPTDIERVRSRTHLHEALKRLYAGEGEMECAVGGFFVDGRRDGVLYEVQVRNLAGLRPKLERLLDAGHRVVVIHPVAVEKFIVRCRPPGGTVLGRRRSPRRGRWTEAFDELVFLKGLLARPGLSVHVVSTAEEEWRRAGTRRRRPMVVDRRLLAVLGVRRFAGPGDWAAALPPGLPAAFNSRDVARALGEPRWRAQAMLYVLAASGAVRPVGRDRNGVRYHLGDSCRSQVVISRFSKKDDLRTVTVTGCGPGGSSPSARASAR